MRASTDDLRAAETGDETACTTRQHPRGAHAAIADSVNFRTEYRVSGIAKVSTAFDFAGLPHSLLS